MVVVMVVVMLRTAAVATNRQGGARAEGLFGLARLV